MSAPTYDLAIIVCGGRKYADHERVNAVLDKALESVRDDVLTVIEGGAPGADDIAAAWADHALLDGKRVKHEVFRAQWRTFGLRAGPLRNQQMLDFLLGLPEQRKGVIAFPGHDGTADMTERARKAGVNVLEVPRD